MGNYRFRFSDMIPNAWFYKLKDMTKPRLNKTSNPTNKKHNSSSSSPSSNHTSEITKQPQRKSYYFTRDHPNSPAEPPRKSTRRRRSTKKTRPPPPRVVSSSISAGCSCRATLESVWSKPPEDYINLSSSSEHDSVVTEFGSDRGQLSDTTLDGMLWSTTCKCKTENDVVFDMDDDSKVYKNLPPIITKKHDEPTKIQRTSAEFSERNEYGSLSVKVVKEDFLKTSPLKRVSVNSASPGVRLRVNSPRIANRRIQGRKSVSSSGSRRSVAESFAVVKSSKDPRRDFRESMVEMIVENNIRASKDLEELLACYLSLNSDEYHDIIINVFKQIWFDFIHQVKFS